MKRLWLQLKTETSRMLVIALSGIIIGGFGTLAVKGRDTVLLPTTNKRDIQELVRINELQTDQIDQKLDKMTFERYKELEAEKDKSVQEKLDIIIQLLNK